MRKLSIIFSLLISLCLFCTGAQADNQISVPILTYHNFDPSKPGSMTVSTRKFEQQLQWLKDNGYTVIPLQDLVNYVHGKDVSIPEKAVVITADDGRDSVYKYMLPIVRKYNVPVTLFIYPSSISNASYAMTWNQLRELKDTGLFDIQCHTYWHPNFKQEKKRLSTAEYQKLVQAQLVKAKKVLEEKLNTKIDLLAWPFGIYDDYLEQQASAAGYAMTFSIDAFHAHRNGNLINQPRYLVGEWDMNTFANVVNGNSQRKN